MGRTLKCIAIFFVVVGFMATLVAQEQDRVNVDLDHIYNEWAFSKLESNDGLLIYREQEDFFVNNIRHRARASFKFTKGDDVFLLRYQKQGPRRYCGNHSKIRSRPRPDIWKKGTWKLIENGEDAFLELSYFAAEKGKKYRLTSQIVYEIMHLEEDKMILQKLENDI